MLDLPGERDWSCFEALLLRIKVPLGRRAAWWRGMLDNLAPAKQICLIKGRTAGLCWALLSTGALRSAPALVLLCVLVSLLCQPSSKGRTRTPSGKMTTIYPLSPASGSRCFAVLASSSEGPFLASMPACWAVPGSLFAAMLSCMVLLEA